MYFYIFKLKFYFTLRFFCADICWDMLRIDLVDDTKVSEIVYFLFRFFKRSLYFLSGITQDLVECEFFATFKHISSRSIKILSLFLRAIDKFAAFFKKIRRCEKVIIVIFCRFWCWCWGLYSRYSCMFFFNAIFVADFDIKLRLTKVDLLVNIFAAFQHFFDLFSRLFIAVITRYLIYFLRLWLNDCIIWLRRLFKRELLKLEHGFCLSWRFVGLVGSEWIGRSCI